MTLTAGASKTLVASNRPPSPTSTMHRSAGVSAKARYASTVVISKKLIGSPALAAPSPSARPGAAPLGPATWIPGGGFRCGSPTAAGSRSTRPVDRSIRVGWLARSRWITASEARIGSCPGSGGRGAAILERSLLTRRGRGAAERGGGGRPPRPTLPACPLHHAAHGPPPPTGEENWRRAHEKLRRRRKGAHAP